MSVLDFRNSHWWAGIALAVAVAIGAGFAADFIGTALLGFERSPVSDIMMAIIIGMLIANLLPLPASIGGGLKFCASTVLRIGIVLLGIRLSLFGAGKFTLVALPFVAAAIAIGLTAVGTLGRSIGLSRELSGLIAVGTSICGATAIVATAPLIRARETEVSYAIACITVFGIAAMFGYPLLAHALFEGRPELAGLFLGTSIHETAQVAGAGLMYQDQYDAPRAMDIATVTKLVRNLCMIAVIPLVGVLYAADHRTHAHAERPHWVTMIPWFIVGFALMSALRTAGDLGDRAFGILEPATWAAVTDWIRGAAEDCLLVAMAAVGLTSAFAGMRTIGLKPFALGLFAALLVGVVSVVSIALLAEPLMAVVGTR
ncbi:MAG: putative sulfate exporter family transporter [Woeseiaceae bacterium]|nr:putative sulfate exporter family transporter [Woeseiaceae bacterium]